MSKLIIVGAGGVIAQFNPSEYTLTKTVKIEVVPNKGADGGQQHFIRGESEKLSFDLFFDSTLTGGSVFPQTEALHALAMIEGPLHSVPPVFVIWGPFFFKAIVESVRRRFTLFNPAGLPLRAIVSINLVEHKSEEEMARKTNMQSADHSKRYVVRRGDTLSRVAAQQYRDPGQWRRIAAANGLDNPRRLVPGTVLVLPPSRA